LDLWGGHAHTGRAQYTEQSKRVAQGKGINIMRSNRQARTTWGRGNTDGSRSRSKQVKALAMMIDAEPLSHVFNTASMFFACRAESAACCGIISHWLVRNSRESPGFYLNVWGLLLYEDLRRRRAKTSGNEGELGAALWLVGKGKKKRHCVPWPDLNVLQISSISTTYPVSVCVTERGERDVVTRVCHVRLESSQPAMHTVVCIVERVLTLRKHDLISAVTPPVY
jgi:hypothetical protein